MKIYIRLISLGLFLLLSSCEKLDFTSQENGSAVTDSTHIAGSYPVDSVEQVFIDNSSKPIQNAEVVGYIVGYISGNSKKSCVFCADENAKATNIILASTPVETDPERCIPVQLTNSNAACSSVREALNLQSNPDMLREKVCLTGDIDSYMSSVGLTSTKKYVLLTDDFDYESYYANKDSITTNDSTQTEVPADTINNGTPTDNPNVEVPTDTTQTEEKKDTIINNNDILTDTKDIVAYVEKHGIDEDTAFRIYDVLNYIPIYLEYIGGASGLTNSYTKGYIVGYINGNSIKKAVFDSSGCTVETNIILADSPDETDYNKCIAVQLSTSSTNTKKVREALNLSSHPENLGKCVMIYGNVEKYMGQLGVKNTRHYEFIE